MTRRKVLVVGNGMVGQQFVERLVLADEAGSFDVTVVGEEPRPAYDRVALSSWFDGKTEHDLRLVDDEFIRSGGVDYRFGVRVESIDTERREASLDDGSTLAYDEVVLATGSYPFVPPIAGHDLEGCFVYRTLDDLEQIKGWAEGDGRTTGLVIGGGLLGLEAANALRALGLEVHVVEMAPYPMPQQLGEGGGKMLSRSIEELGVQLHCGVAPEMFMSDKSGAVSGLRMADGTEHPCDLVVFSAGIRPRDDVARTSGIEVGDRGGVVVDDTLATSAENVWAIGEVALHRGRVYGLVAPGYKMATILAERLGGSDSIYEGSDLSTKLKLLGVDVASFGQSGDAADGFEEVVYNDPVSKVFRRLVLDAETGALVGGALVGDISGFELLTAVTLGQATQPDDLAAYVLPSSMRPLDDGVLPDAALLCSCNSVSMGMVRQAVVDGCHTVGDVKGATCAGKTCGGCLPALSALLARELTSLGVETSNSLCEHFDYSRQDLFDLIRFHRYQTWSEILANHGQGRGCGICRPTVASILASTSDAHVLDAEHASLQDTNDHHLANMQRNGTYSVIPRVPGGEITHAQLIALGEIAKEFDLYTKITGGQRIGLYGVRLHDLPTIWQRVIDVGMESGQAYGKSLRTVKSCVGSNWCRYGVQDSVGMAIRLEQRYRGLRSPHKIKMGVSGCTRECAEAQSKDVGVIATENGWSLYVCGNGGRSPRHADLFAADLNDEQLIAAIDRFLMFYIRTADRLQRTSTWLEGLDGGLEHLKAVVFDDLLGLADEMETEMQVRVDGYECEWEAAIDEPDLMSHFIEFVNAPEVNSQPVWITERGQRVPS